MLENRIFTDFTEELSKLTFLFRYEVSYKIYLHSGGIIMISFCSSFLVNNRQNVHENRRRISTFQDLSVFKIHFKTIYEHQINKNAYGS